MVKVIETKDFQDWIQNLKDPEARARISFKLTQWRKTGRLSGDIKPLGGGLSELRIHCGAGYRIYFIQKGDSLVLITSAGRKRSQKRDIARARKIAQDLREELQW